MPRTNLSASFAAKPTAGAFISKPRITLRNTFEYVLANGAHVTRLHLTDVCTRTPAKPRAKDKRERYTLDSGGYRTMTTKDRINHALRASPYRVVSGRGAWFVTQAQPGESVWNTPNRVPFYDGITLPDAFERAPAKAKSERELKRESALQAQIKKFVDSKLANGAPIPQPNSGDCWHCLMFDREDSRVHSGGSYMPNAERPVKDRSAEHLRSHIRESYLPGALIVNALRDRGTGDAGIALYMRDTSPRNMRELRRIVRRYLQKRLGLPFR